MNNIFSPKWNFSTLILSVTLIIGIFSIASPSPQNHASNSKTQSEQLISRVNKKKKQIFFHQAVNYEGNDSNLHEQLILSLLIFNREVEVQSHLNNRRILSSKESIARSYTLHQAGDRGDHINDSTFG